LSNSLTRLVYLSDNLIRGDEEAVSASIEQMLSSSRRRNQELSVTGALIFNRGIFAQVLEGPTEGVTSLFRAIEVDPRHCKIKLLEHASVVDRLFPNWSMAYFGLAQNYGCNFEEIATETQFDEKKLLFGQAVSAGGMSLLKSLTLHWKTNVRPILGVCDGPQAPAFR
jgi:hypothetical protein